MGKRGRNIGGQIFALLSVAALATVGCSGGDIDHLNTYAADIDPERWSSAALFEIENSDTLSLRDISVFVRHQPQSMLNSLRFSIETITPDSVSLREEFAMKLNKEAHRRRGATLINESIYRTNVRFKQVGQYKISIIPSTPIKGVEAVGVRIE